MKRSQYLLDLRAYLSGLPKSEVDDIIRDQEEYINDALERGRSEEEVLNGLGDPKTFANSLLVESKIDKAQKTVALKKQIKRTFNAAIAIIALTPFNLFFIVIPLTIFIILTFLGWAIAVSIFIVAFILLQVFFTKLIFFATSIWIHISFLFFVFGVIGVGVLALAAAYKMMRIFVRTVLSYFRWNLNLIKNRTRGNT